MICSYKNPHCKFINFSEFFECKQNYSEIHFKFEMFLLFLCIWHSTEPWKSALSMKDPDYLPAPPIFALIWHKSTKHHHKLILCDQLSVRKASNQKAFLKNKENLTLYKNFSADRILKQLNRKINPQKAKKELINSCMYENISQACLILGRIYEFGAYNETENLTLSYYFYNRVLLLNDSTSNSPLAFFHRHIYPNIPLSIVQDDYNSNYIESILSKSIQFEKSFGRPFSCQKVTDDLIQVSDILVNMYLQQPGLHLTNLLQNLKKKGNKSNQFLDDKNKSIENLNDQWEHLKKGVAYMTKPYPSIKEIKKARSHLRSAIDGKCVEALPFVLKLQISLSSKILNEIKEESAKKHNENSNESDKKQNENSNESDKKHNENSNKSDKKHNENSNENDKKQNENSNENDENNRNIENIEFDENDKNKQNFDFKSRSSRRKKTKEGSHRISNFAFENHILLDQNHPMHPSELLSMIEPLIDRHDPEALLLASSHYMRSSVAVAFKPYLSTSIINSISESSYPPAIHRLAELTYFGLMQIKRSAKDAFILYLKSAACGYNPSILAAAKQLVGGDGVCEDCEMAASLLRGIVDSGPWSIFYDKYVKFRRSKVAFLRMIEMGLTPPIWLDQHEIIDSTIKTNQSDLNLNEEQMKFIIDDELKKALGSIKLNEEFHSMPCSFDCFMTKKVFEEICLIPEKFRNNEFLDNIRMARNGDGHSLLWLIMNSNTSDALKWLERLESFPVETFYISKLLKIFIMIKGALNYGNLSEFDKILLKMMILPFFNDFLIFLVTVLLVFFVSMRIHYVIS